MIYLNISALCVFSIFFIPLCINSLFVEFIILVVVIVCIGNFYVTNLHVLE
jgi:hypothetical protein